MASIYKRSDCDTYQCQYYVKNPATGELTKVRKSTGMKNKKKAQEAADEWEMILRSGSRSPTAKWPICWQRHPITNGTA